MKKHFSIFSLLLILSLLITASSIFAQSSSDSSSASNSSSSSGGLTESQQVDLGFQGFEQVTEGSFIGRGDSSTFIGRPVGNSATASRNTRTTISTSSVRRTTSSRTSSNRLATARTSTGGGLSASGEIRSKATAGEELQISETHAENAQPESFNRGGILGRRMATISDTATVSFDATSGEATLRGTANSLRERRTLEQLLRLEPGVQRVRNEMRLFPAKTE